MRRRRKDNMDMNEIDSRRHELLDALRQELNEGQVAAVVTKDEGQPEMVNAILDELGDRDMGVAGDFFFRPIQDEDDAAWVFLSVFTITNEIPAERLQPLYEAMSYINFNIPVGHFCIDKDHKFLTYISSSLIPADLEDDEIFREMDIAVGNAFATADSYINILTDVLKGTIGPEGIVEFLGGPAEA